MVVINFPYYTDDRNSMGVYVRDIYRCLRERGVDAAVCCIARTDAFDHLIFVSSSLRPGPLRYMSLVVLYARLLIELIGRDNVVVLNISQEFVAPTFCARSVVIFHDLIQLDRPRNRYIKIYMKVMTALARRSAKTIAVSGTTRDALSRMGIDAHMVYSPFDFARIKRFRASVDRDYDGCWCGTSAPHKNLELFLNLAAHRDKQRFALVLPKRDAEHIQVPPNVYVFSDLPGDAYLALLASARVFLSTSSAEGYGRPPMEALVLGARLCLSDIPVYREIYGAWATFFQQTPPDLVAGFDEALAESLRTGPVYPSDGALQAVTGTVEEIVDLLLAERNPSCREANI